MKTDPKIISIGGKEDYESKRKQDMIDVLDEMRRLIQIGQISEFVACSVDSDGIAQIHACTLDLPGGVGLFEIGKHMLIQMEN